jgi:transposase
MRKNPPSTPSRPNRRTMWPQAPEPPLENALYVGIDVSQEHLDAAVVDGRGNIVRVAQRYDNTGPGFLKLWDDTQGLGRAPSRRPVAYALEASGIYHLGVLDFLLGRGARTWAFNPLLLQGEKKSRVRKTKTDALDAELIAQFARKEGASHRPAARDADAMRLREHCRVRFRLVEKASDTKRQLRRDLDTLCPRLGAELSDVGSPMAVAVLKTFAQVTRRFTATVEEIDEVLQPFYREPKGRRAKALAVAKCFEDRDAPEALEEPLLWEVRALVHLLELLEEQIRQAEGRIRRAMAERKSLVTTVPGIGPITAAVIESELGDARRFENANEVRAFAGLDPSVYQSGKFEGTKAHISKRGSPRLREALYQAALSASRVNPACRDLYERLMARGKAHRAALTAVSGKLLIHAWAVLREGKSFQIPERYRVEATEVHRPKPGKSEEPATA